ncbi:dolichyl-phosphate beta-glucosyltransferase [Acidobacteriota bacterium]
MNSETLADDIFLSVVIPAYNEEGRIANTLVKIREYLHCQDYSSEIIVVNDGSTDLTDQSATEILKDWPNFRLLSRIENKGKGYTVKEGILNSRGQMILFSDADLSTPIEELENFFPWADEYAVLIGSRSLPDSDIQVHQSFLREIMGKTFNFFVQLLIFRGIIDTQCGFKLFHRQAALDIFNRIKLEGFGFDVEALYIAQKLGYRIKQLPVVWRNSPESRVHIIRSSVEMFLDLFRVRSLHKSLKKE